MKRLNASFSIAAYALLAGAIALLNGCSDSTTTTEQASAPLRAEMLVRLDKQPGFGCLSEALFLQAVGHSVAQEKTKFKSMFDRMECIVLPGDPNARFKLLAVHGNRVEFTNATNQSASNGLWASKDAFVQAE